MSRGPIQFRLNGSPYRISECAFANPRMKGGMAIQMVKIIPIVCHSFQSKGITVSIVEMASTVGRYAEWRPAAAREMAVMVRIIDVRNRYGAIDVRITPVSGSGDKWVSIDSVRFAESIVP